MHIAFDDPAESGRALGHDLYRLTRLHASLDWPRSVREGYDLARTTRVPRSAADVYQRKWLQLRLSAQARGRFVSEEVTPHYLRRIDVAICPVLRIPLTRGTLGGTDWSVDRLNNAAAYAANNLAVMSTRANRAKGERDFNQVLRLARLDVSTDGLTPAEWLRLAALMLGPCFAARPADAPDIPMPVPIPNCTVRMATQQVQYLLASRCERHAGKNALVKSLRTVLENGRGAGSLRLLAESVHEQLKGVDHPWDVWLADGPMSLLTSWRAQIGGAAWGRVGALSCRLIGGQPIGSARLIDWHLPSRGYLGRTLAP